MSTNAGVLFSGRESELSGVTVIKGKLYWGVWLFFKISNNIYALNPKIILRVFYY